MSSIGGLPDGLRSAATTVTSLTAPGSAKAQEALARQDASENTIKEEQDDYTDFTGLKNFTKADKSEIVTKLTKAQEAKAIGEVIPIEEVKEAAGNFEQKHPEHKKDFLVSMLEKITPEDSSEVILKKVSDSCKNEGIGDAASINTALHFLLEVTRGGLKANVEKAIKDFGAVPDNKRAIVAAENIVESAREAAKTGVGETSEFLTLYQDVTKNPRDSVTLFFELKNSFPNYKDRKVAIAFLLKSLGAEKESKSPSIEHAKLQAIINEIGSVRSAGKVWEFFEKRETFINSMFESVDMRRPPQMTFEALSEAFMAIVRERYPSSEKVLQQLRSLGCDIVEAKIVAVTQIRDAVREVSLPKIYRSVAHRDEVYTAIIEAAEELEDQLEDQISKQQLEED